MDQSSFYPSNWQPRNVGCHSGGDAWFRESVTPEALSPSARSPQTTTEIVQPSVPLQVLAQTMLHNAQTCTHTTLCNTCVYGLANWTQWNEDLECLHRLSQMHACTDETIWHLDAFALLCSCTHIRMYYGCTYLICHFASWRDGETGGMREREKGGRWKEGMERRMEGRRETGMEGGREGGGRKNGKGECSQ